jgi:hypothetical protein
MTDFKFPSRSVVDPDARPFSVADPDHLDTDPNPVFHFYIWIRILLFTLILIWIKLFDKDPDSYSFKEVMYLKRSFYTS